MTKMCKVCGYSIENDNIRECPNCGSFDLKIMQSGEGKLRRFRLT